MENKSVWKKYFKDDSLKKLNSTFSSWVLFFISPFLFLEISLAAPLSTFENYEYLKKIIEEKENEFCYGSIVIDDKNVTYDFKDIKLKHFPNHPEYKKEDIDAIFRSISSQTETGKNLHFFILYNIVNVVMALNIKVKFLNTRFI